MTIKHYAEIYYPGAFVSETTTQEVISREAPFELPSGAYGYRLFSRQEIEKDGELLVGQAKDYGPMTYVGEVLTIEQVRALPGDFHILISNMENNGIDRVVRTVRGNFQPLGGGDIVLPTNR